MTILAALALLVWSGAGISAQTAETANTRIQAGNTALNDDPTRPEVQPRLDTDRDPIPSPDPDLNPAANEAFPSASNAAGPLGASNRSANGTTEMEKQQNGMYILHANVDEVLLNCAVIDAKGLTVTDLSRGDFRVWEDGVPEIVNSVQHLDLPVSIGILIDNSGSMRDKRAAVNAAAAKFFNTSNPEDEAFVVNFTDRPYLDQRFTTAPSTTALLKGTSSQASNSALLLLITGSP